MRPSGSIYFVFELRIERRSGAKRPIEAKSTRSKENPPATVRGRYKDWEHSLCSRAGLKPGPYILAAEKQIPHTARGMRERV
jgi:hypothetical protein